MQTMGFACTSADEPLAPFTFDRRAARDNDLVVEILYSGVCHSDLHQARNDWGWSTYPMVPGHEIVGQVIEVGSAVKKYKVGDKVGIGCMVDSCLHCDQCLTGEEQLCRKGNTQTYNSPDRITGENTFGGYAKHIVVREEFAVRVPDTLDLSRVAPLLCAGITTYAPLRTYNVGPGSRVGVVGMGGLGHMAIKLAIGLGADVTVISRSPAKEEDARELGATHFLLSTDQDALAAAASSFDLIVDTVPVEHGIDDYTPLLDINGTICLVGQVGPVSSYNNVNLLMGRRSISASMIGGIRQTQEMMDFCGRMGILPECETIRMHEINEAFDRLERADVHYRFVIDMASLQVASAA
ncbi:alcohol dehydrogenase catalytic domain-containing protein [Rhizobium leguminosarum bv. viciae]|uniref:NAD(P)-dependent alcohol dehydrogenase n=1 Tax=Rhizobium leguminosarum TaxID=384 RepID=UPI001441403E|nr:NAD(P)-dependent alcohol dehydrogenase [Rhizobium leguminosarum]NKJ94697.1 alcohol dehydrogenase catalytic domain-containing protein [Rhizobium leguminosarum bv. viciae]NKK87489.1 alcohol dehydrogenase catalytic domain-containing protein [Rhizobium leguminosarum bv. viciae]